MASGRRMHRPMVADLPDLLPPFTPPVLNPLPMQWWQKRRKGQKLVPLESWAFPLVLLFMLTRRKRRR